MLTELNAFHNMFDAHLQDGEVLQHWVHAFGVGQLLQLGNECHNEAAQRHLRKGVELATPFLAAVVQLQPH